VRRRAAYDRVVAQAPAPRHEGGRRRPQRSHGASLVAHQHGAVPSHRSEEAKAPRYVRCRRQMQPRTVSTRTPQIKFLVFFLKLSRRRRFPRRPTRSRKQRARGRRHPETGLGVSGRDATWGRGAMLFVALLPPPGPGPGLGFGRCVAGRGTLPRVRGCGRADRGAGTVTLRSHAGSRTGIDNTRHACEIIAIVGL